MMEGTGFGRYRLVDMLGRGGMGEVWRAFDTVTERVVALKLLPAQFADDELFQQRFRREARSAAGLSEPHVIPIFDFGEIDGRLFVTMRLIEGEDLQAVINRGPLPPARAVGIIEQIASALHAAHRVDLVHRDVKPSNILIAENDFAYLIDFGIARAAGETGLTNTGATIGTWAYMAPERFEHGTADASVDVYALTCVLHQALTGQLPFPGNSLEQIAMAHMVKPPPQPSTLERPVPAEMDTVIATGMAKDPRERYATTVELASAAHDAITTPIHRPTTAPLAQPPRKHVTAPPKKPATHVERDAEPPTRPASLTDRDTRPPPEVSTPPPPRGERNRWLVPGIAALVVVAAVAGAGIYAAADNNSSDAIATSTSSTTTAQTTAPTTSTTSTPTGPPPVAVAQLAGLLLSPDQINTAMGATGMTFRAGWDETTTINDSDAVADNNCRPLFGAAGWKVYGDTGYVDVRTQQLREEPKHFHIVTQAVVMFPSAQEANAFFTASVASWPACTQFTETYPGAAPVQAKVGPISNANGILSATVTNGHGEIVRRALTVVNNIAVDVDTRTGGRISSPADSAVDIAHQIAAKVPT